MLFSLHLGRKFEGERGSELEKLGPFLQLSLSRNSSLNLAFAMEPHKTRINREKINKKSFNYFQKSFTIF